MQLCIAFTNDSQRWFVINAPPDLPRQITSLGYRSKENSVRGCALAGILLTNADLDHSLGLFMLREGEKLHVWAPPTVKNLLCQHLHVDAVLGTYCGIDFHTPPKFPAELFHPDGSPTGLLMNDVEVPGHAPRYVSGEAVSGTTTVGYHIVDSKTGGRLVCIPDIAAIDHRVLKELHHADAILIDGTFWSDDELISANAGTLRAFDMGHLPVGGTEGILAAIKGLPAKHKVFVHINNTNPMLLEDSPQRRAVQEAGCVVGYDGMELEL
jgi:pyrroloquinoline quinone biosynthesis protein B